MLSLFSRRTKDEKIQLYNYLNTIGKNAVLFGSLNKACVLALCGRVLKAHVKLMSQEGMNINDYIKEHTIQLHGKCLVPATQRRKIVTSINNEIRTKSTDNRDGRDIRTTGGAFNDTSGDNEFDVDRVDTNKEFLTNMNKFYNTLGDYYEPEVNHISNTHYHDLIENARIKPDSSRVDYTYLNNHLKHCLKSNNKPSNNLSNIAGNDHHQSEHHHNYTVKDPINDKDYIDDSVVTEIDTIGFYQVFENIPDSDVRLLPPPEREYQDLVTGIVYNTDLEDRMVCFGMASTKLPQYKYNSLQKINNTGSMIIKTIVDDYYHKINTSGFTLQFTVDRALLFCDLHVVRDGRMDTPSYNPMYPFDVMQYQTPKDTIQHNLSLAERYIQRDRRDHSKQAGSNNHRHKNSNHIVSKHIVTNQATLNQILHALFYVPGSDTDPFLYRDCGSIDCVGCIGCINCNNIETTPGNIITTAGNTETVAGTSYQIPMSTYSVINHDHDKQQLLNHLENQLGNNTPANVIQAIENLYKVDVSNDNIASVAAQIVDLQTQYGVNNKIYRAGPSGINTACNSGATTPKILSRDTNCFDYKTAGNNNESPEQVVSRIQQTQVPIEPVCVPFVIPDLEEYSKLDFPKSVDYNTFLLYITNSIISTFNVPFIPLFPLPEKSNDGKYNIDKQYSSYLDSLVNTHGEDIVNAMRNQEAYRKYLRYFDNNTRDQNNALKDRLFINSIIKQSGELFAPKNVRYTISNIVSGLNNYIETGSDKLISNLETQKADTLTNLREAIIEYTADLNFDLVDIVCNWPKIIGKHSNDTSLLTPTQLEEINNSLRLMTFMNNQPQKILKEVTSVEKFQIFKQYHDMQHKRSIPLYIPAVMEVADKMQLGRFDDYLNILPIPSQKPSFFKPDNVISNSLTPIDLMEKLASYRVVSNHLPLTTTMNDQSVKILQYIIMEHKNHHAGNLSATSGRKQIVGTTETLINLNIIPNMYTSNGNISKDSHWSTSKELECQWYVSNDYLRSQLGSKHTSNNNVYQIARNTRLTIAENIKKLYNAFDTFEPYGNMNIAAGSNHTHNDSTELVEKHVQDPSLVYRFAFEEYMNKVINLIQSREQMRIEQVNKEKQRTENKHVYNIEETLIHDEEEFQDKIHNEWLRERQHRMEQPKLPAYEIDTTPVQLAWILDTFTKPKTFIKRIQDHIGNIYNIKERPSNELKLYYVTRKVTDGQFIIHEKSKDFYEATDLIKEYISTYEYSHTLMKVLEVTGNDPDAKSTSINTTSSYYIKLCYDIDYLIKLFQEIYILICIKLDLANTPNQEVTQTLNSLEIQQIKDINFFTTLQPYKRANMLRAIEAWCYNAWQDNNKAAFNHFYHHDKQQHREHIEHQENHDSHDRHDTISNHIEHTAGNFSNNTSKKLSLEQICGAFVIPQFDTGDYSDNDTTPIQGNEVYEWITQLIQKKEQHPDMYHTNTDYDHTNRYSRDVGETQYTHVTDPNFAPGMTQNMYSPGTDTTSTISSASQVTSVAPVSPASLVAPVASLPKTQPVNTVYQLRQLLDKHMNKNSASGKRLSRFVEILEETLVDDQHPLTKEREDYIIKRNTQINTEFPDLVQQYNHAYRNSLLSQMSEVINTLRKNLVELEKCKQDNANITAVNNSITVSLNNMKTKLNQMSQNVSSIDQDKALHMNIPPAQSFETSGILHELHQHIEFHDDNSQREAKMIFEKVSTKYPAYAFVPTTYRELIQTIKNIRLQRESLVNDYRFAPSTIERMKIIQHIQDLLTKSVLISKQYKEISKECNSVIKSVHEKLNILDPTGNYKPGERESLIQKGIEAEKLYNDATNKFKSDIFQNNQLVAEKQKHLEEFTKEQDMYQLVMKYMLHIIDHRTQELFHVRHEILHNKDKYHINDDVTDEELLNASVSKSDDLTLKEASIPHGLSQEEVDAIEASKDPYNKSHSNQVVIENMILRKKVLRDDWVQKLQSYLHDEDPIQVVKFTYEKNYDADAYRISHSVKKIEEEYNTMRIDDDISRLQNDYTKVLAIIEHTDETIKSTSDEKYKEKLHELLHKAKETENHIETSREKAIELRDVTINCIETEKLLLKERNIYHETSRNESTVKHLEEQLTLNRTLVQTTQKELDMKQSHLDTLLHEMTKLKETVDAYAKQHHGVEHHSKMEHQQHQHNTDQTHVEKNHSSPENTHQKEEHNTHPQDDKHVQHIAEKHAGNMQHNNIPSKGLIDATSFDTQINEQKPQWQQFIDQRINNYLDTLCIHHDTNTQQLRNISGGASHTTRHEPYDNIDYFDKETGLHHIHHTKIKIPSVYKLIDANSNTKDQYCTTKLSLLLATLDVRHMSYNVDYRAPVEWNTHGPK